mmetsp:Transcript_351/g.747  ORF Transcript_351/g.747 Transcript_351/m.747 type:complete len:651 (+) Transcript_351:230-2182(+)
MSTTTPRTAPSSPFFKPSTPSVTVVQQTPGGTRRPVRQKEGVQEHKSSILGCTANLVNAIVGSGIVGIPFAVKEAGFGAGIFLIILCAILTAKSLRLLIATAKHVNVPSYETVAEAAFGSIGFNFVAAGMFVMAYGAMASYLMVVKDVWSTALGVDPEDKAQRRAVLFIVSIAIMVPLSSKRDMADLAFTSRLSVIIDTILVGLVVYNAPMSESLEIQGGWEGMASHAVHWDTLFVGLGVLSFAFVCQHSAFIIAGSLENPTIARWSIVTRNALAFCVCLALTCGICGYTGYLEETEGNILSNLDPKSWSANTARAMLGTTMLFVYPLESFVARHVCVVLLFEGRRAHEGEDASVLNRRDRRIGLTVALYMCAVLPAALFDDLGSILAITGAIGGSFLSYIGPGAVYLGVHGERFIALSKTSWLGKMLQSDTNNDGRGRGERQVAGEVTPLLQRTEDTEKGVPSKDTTDESTENAHDSLFASIFRAPVWYLTGMPLWSALARMGQNGVHRHAENMALKSPHPIRIGSVIYKKNLRRMSFDGKPTIERIDSLPLPGSDSLTSSERLFRPTAGAPKSPHAGPGNINKMLGQEILRQQQEAKKALQASTRSADGIEVDPQAQPPSWYDFVVAILFILFGCLALVAGLISLVGA